MSAPIKVCHFTSVHPEKDIRIFYKECIALANAGFEVYLVSTGTLNNKEQGVNFISVKKDTSSRFSRLFKTRKEVYKAALNVNADIYHFHDSELLPYGVKLKRKGKVVVYDAHEDLPRQILSKHYIPVYLRKFVSYLVEKIENYYSSKLSGIIGATPVIESRFKKINPNTISICNYPSLSEFNQPIDWEHKKEEICYIGGIFNVRGGTEMINLLPLINARLNLAGIYSPESYKEELKKLSGWDKVNDYGFVNRDEIKKILDRSILGLMLLHPLRSYIDSLPIKLFEYMAAGIPVIASDFPLWKAIINEGPCGFCVDPFDLDKIAEEINKLLVNKDYAEQLGKNGRRLIEEKYNWEVEQQKLINFYKNQN